MSEEQGADPGGAPQEARDVRTVLVIVLGMLAIAALTAGGWTVSRTVGLFVLGGCLAIGALLLGWEPEPKSPRSSVPAAEPAPGTRRSPTF